jgi:4-hydroxy-tetrahydrodipicolinate synthase
MADALLAQLAREIALVVAIKVESLPPAPKVGAVVAGVGAEASVLGGAGGIDFVHELERGARGTIPGAALPELFVAVWRLFRTGQVSTARSLFNRHLPLLALSARTSDTFLWTQKEILRRRGVLSTARLRAPCEVVDAEYGRELDALLDDLGLTNLGRSWHLQIPATAG